MCLKNTENTWMAFITSRTLKHMKRVLHLCHAKAIQEYINVLLDNKVDLSKKINKSEFTSVISISSSPHAFIF